MKTREQRLHQLTERKEKAIRAVLPHLPEHVRSVFTVRAIADVLAFNEEAYREFDRYIRTVQAIEGEFAKATKLLACEDCGSTQHVEGSEFCSVSYPENVNTDEADGKTVIHTRHDGQMFMVMVHIGEGIDGATIFQSVFPEDLADHSQLHSTFADAEQHLLKYVETTYRD